MQPFIVIKTKIKLNMKSLQILFLLILFSCKKSTVENKVLVTSGIIGKWQMVEYCFSPGDITCPIQKIEKNKGQIIEFKSDGNFIANKSSNNIFALECDGEWQKETEQKLNIVYSCKSLSKKKDLFYKLTDQNQLYLFGNCIEECRFVFEPID
jgi:hypothetical protein